MSFDGCDEKTGAMLEAKGEGYAWALTGPDTWQPYYTGAQQIMDQVKEQTKAAPDRAINWYFAEEPVADYFREQFAVYPNVTVIYQPRKE